MFYLIQKRKYLYIFSTLLTVISVVCISLWGLKLGIDFTGGSLMQVSFQNRPETVDLQKIVDETNLGGITIQPTGDNSVFLRFKDVTQSEHDNLLSEIKTKYTDAQELQFQSVGPILGSELSRRAIWAIALALVFIILYIAFAFRKVSRPVASWKYGVAAVVALIHDVLIIIGLFSILGHFFNVEIDSLFVSAILTVLGFSVHDTIVVYDRIRENLFRGASGDFETIVNNSVNSTLARSINTSLTVEIVLLSMLFLGGLTIKYFTLALVVGIAVGTYSSIFIASALLVDWYKLGRRS